jgi:hypothetical protein
MVTFPGKSLRHNAVGNKKMRVLSIAHGSDDGSVVQKEGIGLPQMGCSSKPVIPYADEMTVKLFRGQECEVSSL